MTRRTTQRQFLLRPSKEVKTAFRYCLALAAKKSGVLLHAVVVMPNHYHIICTDPHGTLPVFSEELNKLVGRCLNDLYDRKENFWAGGVPPSYVALEDETKIFDKTVYTLANPVAAGLVKSGKDWPGVLLFRPGTEVARRPSFFFRDDEAKGALARRVRLELAPLPLAGQSRAVDQLEAAVRAREKFLRAELQKQGRRFLGAKRVCLRSPFDSPLTVEPRRTLSPKLASADKKRRREALEELKAFVEAYRTARALWLSGLRSVVFPHGTYAMRVRHAVTCADT